MTLPKNEAERVAPSQADIEKFQLLCERLGINQLTQRVDEQQKTLDRVISELGNTNTTLAQIIAAWNQFNNQQTQQTVAGPTAANPTAPAQNMGINWKQLDPVSQSQIVSNLFTGLSQVVTAWKGPNPQQGDAMGDLGKQMLTDLVRATVDDIQQRVYGIRKIPPPGIRNDIAQIHKLE